MPHFLRAGLLLALLALPATFSSCTKKTDDPVPPAPTTGGLAGTVSPADALATVTATDGGGLTFVARPATGTGAFALADLKPGIYTLSFAPASGFAAPAPRVIQVVAGQTAAAGIVVAIPESLGTIVGVVSPANAAMRLELVSGTGTVTTTTPEIATGRFSFNGLPLGTYSVRVVMAPRFLPVSPITNLRLSAASPIVDLNVINAQQDLTTRGTATWTADGTTYSATSFNPSSAGPGGLSVNPINFDGMTGEMHTLQLYINSAFNGVGTYQIGGGPGQYATALYSRTLPSGTRLGYTTAVNTPTPFGTISVTNYNFTARTVAGTFPFSALSMNGPSPNLSVTNGSFNIAF